MENYINKQFISFKLDVILSNMMKSHTIPIHPAQDVTYPLVTLYKSLPVTNLVANLVSERLLWYHSACVQVALILLITTYLPHFISSYRHFIMSKYHKKKGEYSTIF